MTQESKLHGILRQCANLPPAEIDLFKKLFVFPGTEAQVCQALQISNQELQERKASLFRKLKLTRPAAAAA